MAEREGRVNGAGGRSLAGELAGVGKSATGRGSEGTGRLLGFFRVELRKLGVSGWTRGTTASTPAGNRERRGRGGG